MSTKAAHTDLPWSAELVYPNTNNTGTRYFEISGMNTIYWVAKVMYEFHNGETSSEEKAIGQANAELIVTAVNNHQELVTRLRDLMNEFDDNYTEGSYRHTLMIESRELLNKLS